MEREGILQKVAPCSLMCHTCTAYEKGVICEHAGALAHYLDGVKEFYRKHMPDAVESYANFEGVLGIYSAGPCPGCRHNGCGIAGCFLLDCTREHGVDFCGQCGEFPCEKTAGIFEEEVHKQWLEGNQAIRDQGIEAFWERNVGKPHYQAYKKQGKERET